MVYYVAFICNCQQKNIFFYFYQELNIYCLSAAIINMGATSSKTISEQVNELAVEQISETISNCTGTIKQQQDLNISVSAGGSTNLGDVAQEQTATLDLECVFSAQKQSEIQRNLSNVLTQFAKAKSEDTIPGLGGTFTEIEANINNKFKSSVKQTDKQETLAAITQAQSANITNVGGVLNIKTFTQKQSAELVAKSILQSSGYSKVVDEVANAIDQTAKTESSGTLSNIANALGMTAATAAMAIPLAIGGIVFLIIFLIALPFMLKGGGSKKNNNFQGFSGYPQMPYAPIGNPYQTFQQPPPYQSMMGQQYATYGGSEGGGDCGKAGMKSGDCGCGCGGANKKESTKPVTGSGCGCTGIKGGCESCGCGCPDDPNTPGMCGEDCPCGCRKKGDEKANPALTN